MSAPFGFTVEESTKQFAILNGLEKSVAERLGGSTKVVKLAGEAANPEEAADRIAAGTSRSEKFSFGVSVYGRADAGKLARRLKRQLAKKGATPRYVPAEKTLSTAQVLHNKLIGAGYEWCLLEQGGRWHYGRTVWIQDLEGFSKRDYDKPAADAKRGMLPPKLARVMVNLAARPVGDRIYDPFCGSGAVLIESMLLDYRALGSDISPRAATDTMQNLKWLKKEFLTKGSPKVTVADASGELPYHAEAIVTEGYLGHPVRQTTSFPEILEEERIVTSLVNQFLSRATESLPAKGRIVLTVPLWKVPHSGDRRIELVDRAEQLGYTIIRPVPADFKSAELTDRGSILVSRPGQRVIHELYILEKA